jgi:hypothetical protein
VEATRIKHITQVKSSIVLIEIRIHQRLDLWVAEICPSRPPIAAASRPLVWWAPLQMISHPPVSKGVVAMSCILGKSLSSTKSALSIGILPIVAAPVSSPVSPSG